jgi:hypothetical protein
MGTIVDANQNLVNSNRLSTGRSRSDRDFEFNLVGSRPSRYHSYSRPENSIHTWQVDLLARGEACDFNGELRRRHRSNLLDCSQRGGRVRFHRDRKDLICRSCPSNGRGDSKLDDGTMRGLTLGLVSSGIGPAAADGDAARNSATRDRSSRFNQSSAKTPSISVPLAFHFGRRFRLARRKVLHWICRILLSRSRLPTTFASESGLSLPKESACWEGEEAMSVAEPGLPILLC